MSKGLYVAGGMVLTLGGLYALHRYRHPLAAGYQSLPAKSSMPEKAAFGRSMVQVAPSGRLEFRKPDAVRVLESLKAKGVGRLTASPGGQDVHAARLESPPDDFVGTEAPSFPLVYALHAQLQGGFGASTSPGVGEPQHLKMTDDARWFASTAASSGWDVFLSASGDDMLFLLPGAPDPTKGGAYILLIAAPPPKAKGANAPPAILPAPSATAGYRTWRRYLALKGV